MLIEELKLIMKEITEKRLIQINAANQQLLEALGITMENIGEHEIYIDDKGEIVKVLRVMKATIWERKQNAN